MAINHKGHAHPSTPAARTACRLAGGGDGSQAPKSKKVSENNLTTRNTQTLMKIRREGDLKTRRAVDSEMQRRGQWVPGQPTRGANQVVSAPKGKPARAPVQPLSSRAAKNAQKLADFKADQRRMDALKDASLALKAAKRGKPIR